MNSAKPEILPRSHRKEAQTTNKPRGGDDQGWVRTEGSFFGIVVCMKEIVCMEKFVGEERFLWCGSRPQTHGVCGRLPLSLFKK